MFRSVVSVVLLGTLLAPASALGSDKLGGYGFASLGGGADIPLAAQAHGELGGGLWIGYFDREYLSGRMFGIGPTYRASYSVGGLRHDLVGEIRLHQELVLGGAYVFAAGGAQWHTKTGCSAGACVNALGWTSRLGIGVRLRLSPWWAVALRLDGGVDGGDAITGRVNLGVGVELL